MIVGIGVDTLAVARMERELQRDPEGFCGQLFSTAELAGCVRQGSFARHCAELFAAKEALFKALALEHLDTGAYREVEVLRTSAETARFLLHGRVLRRAEACGANHIYLSLTSNRDVASALVVLEATSGASAPLEGSIP
jgi:holo-[acyl-carrier protein] synthase